MAKKNKKVDQKVFFVFVFGLFVLTLLLTFFFLQKSRLRKSPQSNSEEDRIIHWKTHTTAQCSPRLLRHVAENDIVFYESRFDFSHDTSNVGYNIGDLLNIPYLGHRWDQNPYHHSQIELDRFYVIARICKGSILDRYVSSRPTWEPIPNVKRLCQCTDEYILDNRQYLEPILNMVKEKDTLTVHVRTGDMRMDDFYIQDINTLASNFKTVIILAGIHLDTITLDHQGKVNTFLENTNSILQSNDKIYAYIDIPDVHISMMRKASHLLVYRGGFSGIGAAVAQGKVYATSRFYHAGTPRWTEQVPKQITIINNFMPTSTPLN